jgi:hypothetical protein
MKTPLPEAKISDPSGEPEPSIMHFVKSCSLRGDPVTAVVTSHAKDGDSFTVTHNLTPMELKANALSLPMAASMDSADAYNSHDLMVV